MLGLWILGPCQAAGAQPWDDARRHHPNWQLQRATCNSTAVSCNTAHSAATFVLHVLGSHTESAMLESYITSMHHTGCRMTRSRGNAAKRTHTASTTLVCTPCPQALSMMSSTELQLSASCSSHHAASRAPAKLPAAATTALPCSLPPTPFPAAAAAARC